MSKEYREPRKKSFNLYYDNELAALEELSDEELGLYYRAIVMHEIYGQATEIKDRTVRTLAKATTRTMDRDLKKYQNRCEKNKENRNKQGKSNHSSPVVTTGTNTDTDTDTEKETEKEKDNGTGTVPFKGSCANSIDDDYIAILKSQIHKIYYDNQDSYYDKDTIQSILIYYLNRYQSVIGEPHSPIATDKLKDIVEVLHVINGEYEEELFRLSDHEPSEAIEIYQALIDKHFDTNYGECDYSIYHFMSGDIRKNRYYEELY